MFSFDFGVSQGTDRMGNHPDAASKHRNGSDQVSHFLICIYLHRQVRIIVYDFSCGIDK